MPQSRLETESFVATVIDRVSRQHPHIVIHLVTAITDTLVKALKERSIDFIVARRFGHIADDRLRFEPLYDDPLVVAVGADNPWVRRRRIALADLMNEPWVLPPPESPQGLLVMNAFRGSGVDYPTATVVTAAPDARLTLLATGRFLTIAPSAPIRFSSGRAGIRILPIDLSFTSAPIGIVTLEKRTVSPVAQLFIETSRGIAKRLASRR